MLVANLSGPYWAICSTYTRREICLGNRCPHKNCLHGYPGYIYVISSVIISLVAAKSYYLIVPLINYMFAFHIQDIARLTFIAVRNEKINGKLLTFAGPRAWTTQEVN